MKQKNNTPEIGLSLKAKILIERERKCLSGLSLDGNRPVVSRAKGIVLTDVEGKTYLDFTGGSHCCNVGYSHPEIIAATKKQMEELDFVAHHTGIHSIRIQLANTLKGMVPGNLKNGKVAYCLSGSEATECAIKVARYNTRRPVLFTCLGGYYGGTMGALSLTVGDANLRRYYSPFLPGVVPIPYANCYRCPFGQEYPGCGLLCVDYIEHLFHTVVQPEEVAAIFVEPIQNHGGVIIPPIEYFRKLKKLCLEHGILLIDDEVVTAFGKTGKMFGIEHFAIEPDIMYFGKPFGVGLPLGAILARRDLMENWHGALSTLGGDLLACVRALTMIKIINREKLINNANRVGEHILKRVHEMAEVHPLIGDVREKGLMVGIELVKDHKTKEPAQDETKHIMDYTYNGGLLIGASGPYKNILKLTPPLIITEEQADVGLDIIESSLKKVEQSPSVK